MDLDASHPLVDRMSRLLEPEGIPRTGGRIFGLLLLTEEPLSLDGIAEHLQASKGGISANVRLLEDRGLIELVPKPGDRRDFYRVPPDAAAGPIGLAARRLRQVRSVLQAGQEAGIPSAAARNRIRLALSLYDHLVGLLEDTLEEWRQRTRALGG